MDGKANRNLDIFFTVLWMLILFSGIGFKASAKLFGWPNFNTNALNENRELTAKPDFSKLSAKEYGHATEAWYNDNFAWRGEVITFYKYLHYNVFKSAHGQQVPGRGNWVFRRGGDWPELDDYLGCIKVDDKMLTEWRDLIEGRVMWAEAHGSHYLEVITPMKIQVHPEKALLLPSHIRGASAREQLEKVLETSFAKTNVVFCNDILSAEVSSGENVFFEEDHHVNGYGCYLIYREINRRIRALWYPEITDVPYFKNPPEDVVEGKASGCYIDPLENKLRVVVPGSVCLDNEKLNIHVNSRHYPGVPVYIEQPGDNRYIIMAHDSFLRFPLTTWHLKQPRDFAVPLGSGFNRIAMMIFQRFSTRHIINHTEEEFPDVFVEQFPEGKIIQGAIGYDETVRKAAEFGRAKPVEYTGEAGTYEIMAVFENVKADGKSGNVKIELRDSEGNVPASESVQQGIRRAVFFGNIAVSGEVEAVVSGGTATLKRLEFRK